MGLFQRISDIISANLGELAEGFEDPEVMLKQAIRNLPEEAYFNIIVFNHAIKVFEPSALQANQDNKNKAFLMINDLKASGSTFTYGALEKAFQMAGRGVTDKAYDPGVDTEIASNAVYDTVSPGRTSSTPTVTIGFDTEAAVVRIDMSEYMEKHSVSRLPATSVTMRAVS